MAPTYVDHGHVPFPLAVLLLKARHAMGGGRVPPDARMPSCNPLLAFGGVPGEGKGGTIPVSGGYKVLHPQTNTHLCSGYMFFGYFPGGGGFCTRDALRVDEGTRTIFDGVGEAGSLPNPFERIPLSQFAGSTRRTKSSHVPLPFRGKTKSARQWKWLKMKDLGLRRFFSLWFHLTRCHLCIF